METITLTPAQRAFGEGMQLGAKVEHQAAIEAIATAALHILCKDPGDGVIDLGALGKWYATDSVAVKVF